jgi:cupin fold WbuC family metalloprotein
MNTSKIPILESSEMEHFFNLAAKSERRRYAKILHAPGDEFNHVFNFMQHDSYMQPHLHPSSEKIENISIVDGKVAVIYFDELGGFRECTVLNKGGIESIEVPAFTWHTYVILSSRAATYETMMGVYEPHTWKHMASWAPSESDTKARSYLQSLVKIGSD